MSEPDLTGIAHIELHKNEVKNDEPLTPMQEIDLVLKECKLGLFHIQLLISSLMATLAGVMVSNTTAYLLPSAECDLNMNLVRKGFLNAVPYFGMLFSSMLAGFLTDTFGRKKFLIIGEGGIFFFTVVAGSSQSYEVMVTAKFFEGVLFATAFSAMLTLSTEFCHSSIRDRFVLFQTSFLSVSQVTVAGLSWLILMQDWKYTLFGYLVLSTWNIYLYICSLASLSACILYIFIPESPKFLLSQGKFDEARDVLIQVYKRNTGKSADSFPVLVMVDACFLYIFIPENPKFLLSQGKFDEARDVLIQVYKRNTGKSANLFPYKNIWKNKTDLKLEKEKVTSLKHQLTIGLHNMKPIFRKPLGKTLTLTCMCSFLTMLMYNVTRLWFPQLSTVIEHYGSPDSGDLCQMLDTYTGDLKALTSNATEEEVCVPHKSGTETYINSMIMGSVCIIPFLISGLLMKILRKKTLLCICSSLTFALTLGLRWSSTKIAMVMLFSFVVALAQISLALIQNLLIEFFPTTSRSLALSIMMTCGRVGTLLGNVAFPILLDIGCVIPFYSLAGTMLFVGLMAFFLPGKKKTSS